MAKRRYLVADVEAALRASAGIYSAAATVLAQKYGSCSGNTVRNYVLRYPRLTKVEEEIRETTLDLAETKLKQAIADGNMRAIIFYLRTKGRHRGYIERREVEGVPDGTPIPVEGKLLVEAKSLSTETLEALDRAASEITGADRQP